MRLTPSKTNTFAELQAFNSEEVIKGKLAESVSWTRKQYGRTHWTLMGAILKNEDGYRGVVFPNYERENMEEQAKFEKMQVVQVYTEEQLSE